MMTRLRLILGICASLLAVPFTSQAATYYVATTGGLDSRSCATSQTLATPKQTIGSGRACLSGGDTLAIRTGTYTERLEDVLPSGTAGTPTTVTNYNGEVVTLAPASGTRVLSVIANSYITFHGLIIDAANVGFDALKVESNSNNVTFEDGELKNAPNQKVLVNTSNNFTIRRSSIHGGGTTHFHHGIYIASGSGSLIEDNDIYDNADFGIQLYPDPTSVTVRHNKIHGNAARGCTGNCGQVILSNDTHIFEDNEVYGIVDTSSGGVFVQYTSPSGTIIRHNTIYNSGLYGLYIASGSLGILVQNNIVLANTTNISNNAGSGATLTTNKTTGTITDCTVSTSNFVHKSGSSCIDAGTNIGRAFNGAAPDQGPYETMTATGGTVTANVASVQIDMGLDTPLVPGTTGWTVNNGRTVTGVALSGSSVANLTFSGAACAGESWTASYTPGTASDSALVGNTTKQPIYAFGPIALTNNCVSVGYTLTQTAGAIYGALGSQAISPLITTVGPGGVFAVRTKWKATVADPPPMTTKLQYSVTGEAGTYANVPDAYTADNIKYVGLTVTGMDAHNTPVTLERLTSTFSGMVAGAVVRCDVGCAVPTVDLTQDSESEQVGLLQLDTDATESAVYWFRRVQSDGTVMTYAGGSTPSVTVVSPVIAAPTGLREVGAASNTNVTLIWVPNTSVNLSGYRIYQSSTSGVYGNSVDTITSASAASRQSAMTQWTTILPISGTYYFTVKAIDGGGQESASSNEVTVFRSGFAARSPIVTPRTLKEIGP